MKVKRTVILERHVRRFVPGPSFIFDTNLFPSKLVTKAYLENHRQTCVSDECDSLVGHVYLQTWALPGDGPRIEERHVITKRSYDPMLQASKYALTKRIHFMSCIDCVAQVHVFEGELLGHIQIRVEFKTAKEAEAFVPPDWFGTEVTHDKRYDNYSLAKSGCKELLLC